MKPTELTEHQEGGRFREVFRSATNVTTGSGNDKSALTHIYFSLNPDEVSRFHRVTSDEVWNLYQGEGLQLYIWDGTNKAPSRITLSAKDNCFCYVVSAGTWQAASPIAEKVLVGCSVAPGFEFDDLEIMSHDSDEARLINSIEPSMCRFNSE